MRNLSIILANSPLYDGNRGCVALTASTIFLLDKLLKEKGLNYKLYILDSYLKCKKKQTIEIGGRSINFKPISYPYDISIKGFVKTAIHFNSLIESICILKGSDYIMDLGRGDSFSDIYGKKRFFSTDRIHCLARLFSKPYLILPQTIGPFSDKHVKQKADKTLLNATMVLTRDKTSYNYVKSNVSKQCNVEECIDMAFFLPYKRQDFDRKYIHVGLNVSSLLWRGGYTGKNQFGLKDDYQNVVRSVIRYFLNMQNIKIHLVPHVVSRDGKSGADTVVSQGLEQEFHSPSIDVAPYFKTPIDAKNYISGLDFFMGARMHSTIAAFSSGVPVVPMAYSRKFNGLFLETLKYDKLVDLKSDNCDAAVEIIANAFYSRLELKKIIDNRNGIIDIKKKCIEQKILQFLGV